MKSDFRTIATGIEAYSVDEGTYPACAIYRLGDEFFYGGLHSLTTPIAYMTNIPHDPFGDREQLGEKVADNYEFGCGKAGQHSSRDGSYPYDTWLLESAGPDNYEDTDGSTGYATRPYPWAGRQYSAASEANLLGLFYDPTNGTVSRGQIFRTGGVPPPERLVKLFFDLAGR